MRIFLDTSVLSDADLAKLSEQVLERYLGGDQFFICSVSHFQIEWGYSLSGRPSQKYRDFLNGFHIEVAPLTKLDAEDAAKARPSDSDVLDALIAACVKRHDASVWTADRDFGKFLPKSKVCVF